VFVGEVPIVLAILMVGRRLVDVPPDDRPRLDLVGTALSALGLALVVFGILQSALDKAGVPKDAADAIVDENATVRVDALRSSLAVIAVIALMALCFGGGIPAEQAGTAPRR
jgi:hypothetical protein